MVKWSQFCDLRYIHTGIQLLLFLFASTQLTVKMFSVLFCMLIISHRKWHQNCTKPRRHVFKGLVTEVLTLTLFVIGKKNLKHWTTVLDHRKWWIKYLITYRATEGNSCSFQRGEHRTIFYGMASKDNWGMQ